MDTSRGGSRAGRAPLSHTNQPMKPFTVLLAVSLSAPAAAAAQGIQHANVVALQVTGDAEARFSMVVLGDGYTAAEMPKFREQVDKHLNVLWSIEPFRSYRNYINVYAVEVVSQESGITCDPEVREQRDTPLKTHFSGGCENPNARGILVDQKLAQAHAERATPHYDQILVLANTDTYGGIGGRVATTSGGNSLGVLITPHELGHSLGGLQDEYTYSARGKPGGPYEGGEPKSIHMTLLTEAEMKAKQLKWWRWLGEESLSGGVIGCYEGGSSRTTGIWRPSKHSMMISVGYYFDQVSLERMVQRISEQVELIADSTPADRSVMARQVIWIDTPQPVYHQLDVTWEVDGKPVPKAARSRVLDLRNAGTVKEGSTVTVTVVDPTEFVRDPDIRAQALTAKRSWKVGPTPGLIADAMREFSASTQTERPVGGQDVIYVRPAIGTMVAPRVSWQLNGRNVRPLTPDGQTFELGAYNLTPGAHRVTARIETVDTADSKGVREWVIDNTPPTVAYTLTESEARQTTEGEPHYLMRDEFTMALDPKDDQPGYVVAEFRVNGDGWHHFYGWPDAPPGTPYRFTPRGTNIKELIYGSLSSEGLSPQPWEPREPGWGNHRIEYRGIDAAGNIGEAKAFRVTFLPSPQCTQTITAPHAGDLRVTAGTTCVTGTSVKGPVVVEKGASLVARKATLASVSASGAASVEILDSTVEGAARITGTTGHVTLFGTTVKGERALSGNAREW
ncbi:M64 family metallopeptidase [soil metagenome]